MFSPVRIYQLCAVQSMEAGGVDCRKSMKIWLTKIAVYDQEPILHSKPTLPVAWKRELNT